MLVSAGGWFEMKKTNAARILDRLGLEYRLLEFDVDEDDLSAQNAARKLGLPPEQIFKTLVARGDKSGVIIASVPGGSELDLKALARVSGNKKVELVPLKEIRPLTGYIRGAVSPLGLKSNFPCYLDQSAFDHSSIIISAGARGVQISLSPRDLAAALEAKPGCLAR